MKLEHALVDSAEFIEASIMSYRDLLWKDARRIVVEAYIADGFSLSFQLRAMDNLLSVPKAFQKQVEARKHDAWSVAMLQMKTEVYTEMTRRLTTICRPELDKWRRELEGEV